MWPTPTPVPTPSVLPTPVFEIGSEFNYNIAAESVNAWRNLQGLGAFDTVMWVTIFLVVIMGLVSIAIHIKSAVGDE